MGRDFSYRIVKPNEELPIDYGHFYAGFTSVDNLRNRWEGPTGKGITREELFSWFTEFFKKFISINGWKNEYDGDFDTFLVVGEILSDMYEGDTVIISYG